MIDIDLCDAFAVLDYASNAEERGDSAAIVALLDLASDRLSAAAICNVLSATNWEGQRELDAMFGWTSHVPNDEVLERRASFQKTAAAWVQANEPERERGLLHGLVPDALLSERARGCG